MAPPAPPPHPGGNAPSPSLMAVICSLTPLSVSLTPDPSTLYCCYPPWTHPSLQNRFRSKRSP